MLSVAGRISPARSAGPAAPPRPAPQVAYTLPPTPRFPDGLRLTVHRAYKDWLAEVTAAFPSEARGIKAFYDEAFAIFNR